jgi:peptidoglycan/xylan/chitin deacetylase (PgdA/CDA1 family)
VSRLERAAHIFDAARLGKLALRGKGWSGVLVLNYHRVADGSRSYFERNLFTATPDDFDAQVAFVARHCDVIGPGEIEEARRSGPGRYVMFTFDDGYRDHFDAAFPILSSHGVTATFFTVSGFLDRPRLPWWDQIAWMVRSSRRRAIPAGEWLTAPLAFDEPEREEAVSTLLARYRVLAREQAEPFLDFLADATGSGRPDESHAADLWMSWDMVRELSSSGMSIGGHTVNHPHLTLLPEGEQRAEISGCADRLRAELGDGMSVFSYPGGAFNEVTRGCLQGLGVQYAFRARGGYSPFDRSWDAYGIRRTSIEGSMTLDRFRSTVTLPQLFARW